MWKNVENLLKTLKISTKDCFEVLNVENFCYFYIKMWKNNVIIFLPLNDKYDDI